MSDSVSTFADTNDTILSILSKTFDSFDIHSAKDAVTCHKRYGLLKNRAAKLLQCICLYLKQL